MPSLCHPGHTLAGLLLVCLLLVPWQQARADLLDRRDTPDMGALMAQLDRWLDRHSDLAPAPAPPRVRLIDRHAIASLTGAPQSAHGGRPRGLYDPASATIWLIRPWDPRDPHDVSVLLHEMVHHRQRGRHWYCPGAQELPAYRLQDRWLNALGLEVRANWIAVVLEAGCSRSDIHPD